MAGVLSPEEIAFQQANISQNKGSLVVGLSIALTVIPAIAVVLRFAARHVQKLPFKTDDWLTIPALVMIILMCAMNILSVQFGLGRHLTATDPTQGYKILEIGFFLSIVTALAHFFVKWSILFFYIRVFNLRLKWFKIAVFSTMAYVAGWAFSFIMIAITQCLPPEYFWQRFNISLNPPASGSCGADTTATVIATSALNTVADIVVLILPLGMLIGLHIKTAKKIGLILIFLVGTFACTASIVRLVISVGAYGDNQDTTYTQADLFLWTIVEASIGLICACFPIVGPGIKVAHKNYSSRSSRAGASGRYLRSSSVDDRMPGSRGRERGKGKGGAESGVDIRLQSIEPSTKQSSRRVSRDRGDVVV